MMERQQPTQYSLLACSGAILSGNPADHAYELLFRAGDERHTLGWIVKSEAELLLSLPTHNFRTSSSTGICPPCADALMQADDERSQ
jgi:hypothetical protein